MFSNDRSNGVPLDVPVREFMESGFGQDFGRVRIHTGEAAAAAAQSRGARAFTAGRDIFFDSGQYAPETAAGLWLLAHELTHVVQREKARSFAAAPGRAGDAFEQEADRAATVVSLGGRAAVGRWESVPGLQCDDHYQVKFPPLPSFNFRSPSLLPPGTLGNLRTRLNYPTFRLARPGPPSHFLPGELTLDLPPVIAGSPVLHFSVPSRGTTGLTFQELDSIWRYRPDLTYQPIGPRASYMDPLLFDLLRDPAMLRGGSSLYGRPSLLSMRDKMTVDVGTDVAVSDSLSLEFWTAMVLQADASSFAATAGSAWTSFTSRPGR